MDAIKKAHSDEWLSCFLFAVTFFIVFPSVACNCPPHIECCNGITSVDIENYAPLTVDDIGELVSNEAPNVEYMIMNTEEDKMIANHFIDGHWGTYGIDFAEAYIELENDCTHEASISITLHIPDDWQDEAILIFDDIIIEMDAFGGSTYETVAWDRWPIGIYWHGFSYGE